MVAYLVTGAKSFKAPPSEKVLKNRPSSEREVLRLLIGGAWHQAS